MATVAYQQYTKPDPTTKLNVELMTQVLDYFEHHPKVMNMVVVARKGVPDVTEDGGCGTTYCIAGLALAMSGRLRDYYITNADPHAPDVTENFVQNFNNWFVEGREVLGLTPRQADRIFYHVPYGSTPADRVQEMRDVVSSITEHDFS